MIVPTAATVAPPAPIPPSAAATIATVPKHSPLTSSPSSIEILWACSNEKCKKSGEVQWCPCRTVAYCEKKCQKAQWKTHKIYCAVHCKKISKPTHFIAPPRLDGPIPVILKDAAGRRTQMTQEQFKKKTTVFFSQKMVFTPESGVDISKFAKRCSTEELKLDAFDRNPPRLMLRECKEVDGLSLVADEPIRSSRTIAYMGGLIMSTDIPDTFRNSLYRRIDNVDHMTYTSMGVFANDGPPCCIIDGDVNGQCILFSIRPIAAGEDILLHYRNNHPVKRGLYHLSEASYKKVIEFIRNLRADHLHFGATNDVFSLKMLQYIFATIPVLMRLLFEKHLPLDGAKTLLEQIETHKLSPNKPVPLLEDYHYLKFYRDLFALVDKLKDTHPSIKQLLIDLPKYLTVDNYVLLLGDVNRFLEENKLELSQESNQNRLEVIINNWKTYYLLKDKVDYVQNGTKIGSFLRKTDPFPIITIDTDEWKSQFDSLPSPQKQQMRTYVAEVLASEHTHPNSKPMLLRLQQIVDEGAPSPEPPVATAATIAVAAAPQPPVATAATITAAADVLLRSMIHLRLLNTTSKI